jgi:DNA-binding XRE family transcriptional regulator
MLEPSVNIVCVSSMNLQSAQLGRITVHMTTALIPEFTVADRLAKARQVTGMTQAEFATELGLVLKTYQRFERGEKDIPRALLIGAAVTAGVSTSWLLTGHADTDSDTREYLNQLEFDLANAA